MSGGASRFWDGYATVGYDALMHLLPYEALQRRVLAQADLRDGAHLLVAGCGTGWLEYLALRAVPGLRVTGVDFSARMLHRARRKCRHFPLAHFVHADLCAALPFAPGTFDAAVMCNVLYALPDGAAALREVARVLRAGARFVLTDPAPERDAAAVRRAHLAALRALPWGQRLVRAARMWAAAPALLGAQHASRRIEAQAHYRFRSGEAATALCRDAGFALLEEETAYAGPNWLITFTRLTETP
jgi:ubiquinone/menaquinone biosynthesis C-methylase UbiE